MPSQSKTRPAPSFDCDAETARRFRNRGPANLLRMGHCAPSIMQAMLDVFEIDDQELVRLMAGMPGGIGNTGGDCGGVTAPLVVLGVRDGEEPMVRGLPVAVYKGHHHLRRFAECQEPPRSRHFGQRPPAPALRRRDHAGAHPLCQELQRPTGPLQSPPRNKRHSVASTNTGARTSFTPRGRGVSSPAGRGSRQRGAAQRQFRIHGRDSFHRDDLQCARRWRHGARPEARPDRDQSSARPAHGRVDGRPWRCVCRRCQRVQRSHESRQSSGAVVHGRVRQHSVRRRSRSAISPRRRAYNATSTTAVRCGAARWLKASRTGC